MRAFRLLSILSLLALLAVTNSSTPAVQAVTQSGPTTWSPFGPHTRNLVMTVYGDFQTMFDAFVDGQVDITDWPVGLSDEVRFAANPDFFLTEGQLGGSIFQLDINHHNSFMGIPMQENRGQDSFNSPSTKRPTVAGTEIRRALAHLFDKPSFINGSQFQVGVDYVDIQAPPIQGFSFGGSEPSKLSPQILAEDCSAHPWFSTCDANNPPVSAYNLVSDNLRDPFDPSADLGWSGPEDLRAACDHFVLAGFMITPSSATCADVATGNGGAHLVPLGQVDFYIRTHAPRRAFGQIFRDAIDFVFGTPCAARYGSQCGPRYFTITEVSEIVFRTEPERDDWNLYTGSWSSLPAPDHLYALYHSSFASSACGGKRMAFAQNYLFYCSPGFDEEATAGQFAITQSDASLHFGNAAIKAHRDVMTVPVYSGTRGRWVALNGWNFQPGTESSLVSQLGYGFSAGFWSLLNMRQKPGYVPVDQRYVSGGGDPNLIRRSVTHSVLHLSPFHATTNWDFEVLTAVYDSMLQANPLTTSAGQQNMDWMTVRHSSTYDPTADVTTQTWILRNDLKWHDGVPLTSEDIAYTILAYRDVPATSFQPSVASVLGAVALGPRTVQVSLTGQSLFYEMDIGNLLIIPKHVWAPICGVPPSPMSQCSDPNFDPMQAGIMVGSGPWICKNVNTGIVGGSCTKTAAGSIGGQEVNYGGRIILTAYDGYHRGRPGVAGSSLHRFSWADKNNDAQVDILDIADAAFHFGAPDQYWNSGQNLLAPRVGTDAARVDIGELATVAFYFEHGLTAPHSPSQLTSLDPDIDPFF